MQSDDPQSFCPWCQRSHDAPEMLELQSKLSTALEELENVQTVRAKWQEQCEAEEAARIACEGRLDSYRQALVRIFEHYHYPGGHETPAYQIANRALDVERRAPKCGHGVAAGEHCVECESLLMPPEE